MKIILILLILVILSLLNLSNCDEFDLEDTNKATKPPVISSIDTKLILNDDKSPYLQVYVNGLFSQKKMNLSVVFNGEEIENFKYQHDNTNKNNTSPDLVMFKLYNEDIVPGNITLSYGGGALKSNKMSFNLKSQIYRSKNPDVTGGLLQLIGEFYYINQTTKPIVTIKDIIDNKNKSCEILQYDNSQIICFISLSSNIQVGSLIEIGNVYDYQNGTNFKFEYNSPSIDQILNVDIKKESLITIVGNNFNKQYLNDFKIFIKEDKSKLIRSCSKPTLLTNSVIICQLNRSLSETQKGDTLYLSIPSLPLLSTEFNLQELVNNNDSIKPDVPIDNGGNAINNSNKYLLMAIIIPSVIVFIFTIVLIIFIFKKRKQDSYFNLMNCHSNELQETSYY